MCLHGMYRYKFTCTITSTFRVYAYVFQVLSPFYDPDTILYLFLISLKYRCLGCFTASIHPNPMTVVVLYNILFMRDGVLLAPRLTC
jgi:hypothetical protein